MSHDIVQNTNLIKRPPLVTSDTPTYEYVTETVCQATERKPGRGWYMFFGLTCIGMGILFVSLGRLFYEGVGIWANSNTFGWAFDITNFVFWIEIAHAGTLVAAILLLFRQKWRTSINRLAEAMTIFAVLASVIFPAFHIGRPWLAHWFFPLPNEMDLWPNFKSPLEWDVFALNTYLLIGLVFWYVGMIPDLATLRDRAKNKWSFFAYGIFALGWRGSARHWQHYEKTCLMLAGLATPTVFSTAGVVSLDFATSILPGWHSTMFPPYFLAGAIFSGLALCLNLLLIVRSIFKFHDIVTEHHIDICAKFLLFMSLVMSYFYLLELFAAYYSGNLFEAFWNANRVLGDYAWAFVISVVCNILIPQTFWFKKLRKNFLWLFLAAILINIGMWFERFVLVIGSLSKTFLPSSWSHFTPTLWEILLFIGSWSLFFHLFALFVRFLPMVNMSEVKSAMAEPKAPSKNP
jgi:Ni/Fe-hydrogenase subunit HybB-like protein